MKKISVIVPVYNKEDYLARCLDSICSQTMPADDVEIICVDDKSLDSSLDILREYEKNHPNMVVIAREENSGTPGIPRNEALDFVSGEYVFFADPDDFLGLGALERMYNYAKKHDSDVVLCKYASVGGRGVPKSMFKKTEPHVDLANSRVIFTLSPQKLFRMSLIKDKNIKFPVYMKSGSDQLFVMKAYLEAKVISVLSDYDYYYLVKHEGEHMSIAYTAPLKFYSGMGEIIHSIRESTLSKERKEKVMAIFLNRHFDFERTKNFTTLYESEKEEWMFYLRKFIVDNVPLHVDELVLPHVRIKLKLIRENDLENLSLFNFEEENHVYNVKISDGDLFRDNESLKVYFPIDDLKVNYRNRLEHCVSLLRFQDEEFQITGNIYHTILNQEYNQKQTLTGVFVHRTSKREKYYPSELGRSDRFQFSIDFGSFVETVEDAGIWDFYIESEIEGYKLRGRIGNRRKADLEHGKDLYFIGKVKLLDYAVRPYFTRPYDNLSFRIQDVVLIQQKTLNKLYEEKMEQKRLIKKQEQLIQEILNSNSWKLTKPLREIANYKKKFK